MKKRRKAVTTSSAPFCPDAIPKARRSKKVSQNIREAIELYVETLTEDGLPIPTEDILIKPIEIPV
ncbi:MAG TPA: type II toxin-antitoxin system HicB family antitoxin [Candidatus Acidoferrales bacterium]|nr:type II toxin-antitoxin system HicB family antitoxin [Candidatus Acidoferrales bacterium]